MYINKLQISIFIVSIILVPSVICFYTFDAFEFPKVYLLTFALLLISLLTLLKKVVIQFTYFDIFFGLFIGVSILSSLFSKDLMYSFFGYFGNPAGSVFFGYSIFIFLLLHKSFLYKIKKYTLLKLILYSGDFPCIYGFMQIFKMDPFNWQNQLIDNRIFSTFGQPNFFAIYLGLLFFCALILYLEYKNKFFLFYIIFICLLLINTKSLSVFISVFLCGFVLIVFNFNKYKHIFLFIFSVLLLVYFFVTYPRIYSQVFGGVGSIKTNDTARIRLILWKNTLGQSYNIKTLLVGNGPENYAFSFKRPAELNTTSEWSLVFFKPHNMFIEVLFSTGIVGLVFYLSLYAYSFFKVKANTLYILPIFLLTVSIFLWLPAYLYFMLFFIFFYLYNLDSKKIIIESSHSYLYFLIPTLYIFVVSLFYSVSNLFYLSHPCVSDSIFPNYQPYVVACGIEKNSDSVVKKGYLINPLNKIYIEKTGLYFLNNHTEYGKDIFETAYYRDPTDPIYMYYYGLSNEVFGNKDKSYELYKNAKSNSHNFYLNSAAIKRLDNR